MILWWEPYIDVKNAFKTYIMHINHISLGKHKYGIKQVLCIDKKYTGKMGVQGVANILYI